MTSADLELPARYERLARLGKGGGGEVWAVRDRYSGRSFALKVLAEEASEREMAALVREAVALSGLEGLGVPRVVRFGRLPESQRPFMVRELVEGRSLEELIADRAAIRRTLDALARAAEQLTLLHRAGLLHGDVKPANIIVQPSGSATLVDLGLAAPWRDGGAAVEGLTPRYAAPELFQGKPLTVRAEVYALGVALSEALESGQRSLDRKLREELATVASRATTDDPDERYPSVDEFASALRRAAGLGFSEASLDAAALWPVVGIDATSAHLMKAVKKLGNGGVLRIIGAPGSGRSALLRRVAWSLGVEGQPFAWIDEAQADAPNVIEAEIGEHTSLAGVTVLVDDADALDAASLERLRAARDRGARLVVVDGARLSEGATVFDVPALDEHAAIDLVRRAVPSLTDRLLKRVYKVSAGRPGELRRLVRLLASEAVANEADIERIIGRSSDSMPPLPDRPLERAVYFLDRGRFNEARAALESADEDADADPLLRAVAHARFELGIGDARAALGWLERVSELCAARNDAAAKQWSLYLARAHVGLGDYARALEISERMVGERDLVGAEALAYKGQALSFLGRHDEARTALSEAVERARTAGSPRIEALALVSFGLALQRNHRLDEARAACESAINAAERAGDAGLLATVQLNLAGLLTIGGDIAGSIQHYEAAVDMGRRSGRRSTARLALLNLANADLYLGRLARAHSSIEALEEQRSQLQPVARAQLSGLEAMLAARSNQTEQAVRLYESCAGAYEALGSGTDAAEARLEGLLVAARAPRADLAELRQKLALARQEIGDAAVHRPLLLLAAARVAWLAGDELEARARLDEALAAAREAAQREWVWRALEARAELEEAGGQPLLARRDREEALAALEEIAARLPRDLREVYWNDPRRRQLRASVPVQLGSAATEYLPFSSGFGAQHGSMPAGDGTLNSASSISSITQTPLEQKLARILEINAELVGALDLEWLTARIIDHAVDLLRAERGFVLLKQPDGTLNVHASRSRSGDEPHAEFSRSIAEGVVKSGQPVVSLSARDDARMRSYASVHHLMLQSVACVPIMAPSGSAIGALYLETRLRPGDHFERELPTLCAFADQVAIALETARLINENRQRADALAETNRNLEEARERLRELLGDRTEQLKRARQKLRDARDTLYGHFGYQGLVGTSEPMRRVYALVERIKDTDLPILITGESGTGKEMVARAIHGGSPRSKSKLLGVNCGAIPEHLLESELFGHMRGAFTGADRDRKGLFREAEGGSLLLDEIGEMPQRMQATLLRVLQERTVRPVGGTSEEPVDVRVFFATNKDLNALVKDGKFREDLYYRIHVVEVRLPPLRERREDIPQLVDHFLGIFAARYKREKKNLSREAMRRLMTYDWPGNVRQLEHVLLNGWVLSEEPDLDADDFDLPDGWVSSPRAASFEALPEAGPPSPAAVEPRSSTTTSPRSSSRGAVASSKRSHKGTLSQHRADERDRILKALQACNWNRVKAAELSGIPRRTFYRRLREYGIQ